MKLLIFPLILSVAVLVFGCSFNGSFSKDHDFYPIYRGLKIWDDIFIEKIIHDGDDPSKVTVIAVWIYGTGLLAESTGVFMFFEKNEDQWKILSLGFEEYDSIPVANKKLFVDRVNQLLSSQ